jgi:hypothetical protein
MTFDRYTRRGHATAALAAAVALAVGVALIATSGGGGSRPHAAPRAPSPPAHRFPHTPAGAAATATAWCLTTLEAFFTGGWDSAVSALAAPAFRRQAERLAGASQMTRSHIAALHVPFALRIWPLGYAVEQFLPASARVHVWLLSALATTPHDRTGFESVTVALQWIGGDWKVTAAPAGPDLTPPGQGATANQVASWIRAVGQLSEYTYVP